jgi:beta-lactamase class A
MKPNSGRKTWLTIGFLLVAALILGFTVTQLLRDGPAAPAAPPPPPTPQIIGATPEGPPPPVALSARIDALGKSFDGRVGIVVRSVEDGWTASFGAAGLFPQQSVSKLWVASTVMGQVDAGNLHLADPITLTAKDLTIFHQPIRKRIGDGAYTTTISELLWFAMTQSDNTANDALFRHVGGQAGVGKFLAAKGLDEIAIGPGEKQLQIKTAGMTWDDSYSHGRTFWHVRETVPLQVRAKALGDYVTNPPDAATPIAVARALAKLQRGELLTRQSTGYLIHLMNESQTGPDRLRSGLSEGWTLAHKTGTGQVLGYYATAYNDVGILSAPSGRHYAVVVMIASTQRPVPERQALMAAVTRAVIVCDIAGSGGC